MKKITITQLAQLLHDLTFDAKESDLDLIMEKFLQLLRKEKKTGMIREIINAYIVIYNKRNGIKRILTTFAHKVDENMLENIGLVLEKEFKETKIEIRKRLDPTILGGIIFRYEDTIIDASVKNKIDTIHSAFLSAP